MFALFTQNEPRSVRKLSTEQLEQIIRARRASEPGLLDSALKGLDEAQVEVRSSLASGIRWLADCIRP